MSVSAGKGIVLLFKIIFVAMNARVSELKMLAW